MITATRVRLALLMLGVAAAVQTGLLIHMMTGPESSYGQLLKQFSSKTLSVFGERGGKRVAVWQFEESGFEEQVVKKLPFKPKDIFFRRGVGPDASIYVETYVVHTENGADREHHPEVCVRDAQQFPEDVSAKAVVKLAGDEAKPVQRLVYMRGPGQEMTIYYWHYTFAPHPIAEQTWLQAVHQVFSRKPPSVTVQVTTTAGRERWPEIEQVLLPGLDQALRSEHLPESVRMGCDRLPIALETK